MKKYIWLLLLITMVFSFNISLNPSNQTIQIYKKGFTTNYQIFEAFLNQTYELNLTDGAYFIMQNGNKIKEFEHYSLNVIYVQDKQTTYFLIMDNQTLVKKANVSIFKNTACEKIWVYKNKTIEMQADNNILKIKNQDIENSSIYFQSQNKSRCVFVKKNNEKISFIPVFEKNILEKLLVYSQKTIKMQEGEFSISVYSKKRLIFNNTMVCLEGVCNLHKYNIPNNIEKICVQDKCENLSYKKQDYAFTVDKTYLKQSENIHIDLDINRKGILMLLNNNGLRILDSTLVEKQYIKPGINYVLFYDIENHVLFEKEIYVNKFSCVEINDKIRIVCPNINLLLLSKMYEYTDLFNLNFRSNVRIIRNMEKIKGKETNKDTINKFDFNYANSLLLFLYDYNGNIQINEIKSKIFPINAQIYYSDYVPYLDNPNIHLKIKANRTGNILFGFEDNKNILNLIKNRTYNIWLSGNGRFEFEFENLSITKNISIEQIYFGKKSKNEVYVSDEQITKISFKKQQEDADLFFIFADSPLSLMFYLSKQKKPDELEYMINEYLINLSYEKALLDKDLLIESSIDLKPLEVKLAYNQNKDGGFGIACSNKSSIEKTAHVLMLIKKAEEMNLWENRNIKQKAIEYLKENIKKPYDDEECYALYVLSTIIGKDNLNVQCKKMFDEPGNNKYAYAISIFELTKQNKTKQANQLVKKAIELGLDASFILPYTAELAVKTLRKQDINIQIYSDKNMIYAGSLNAMTYVKISVPYDNQFHILKLIKSDVPVYYIVQRYEWQHKQSGKQIQGCLMPLVGVTYFEKNKDMLPSVDKQCEIKEDLNNFYFNSDLKNIKAEFYFPNKQIRVYETKTKELKVDKTKVFGATKIKYICFDKQNFVYKTRELKQSKYDIESTCFLSDKFLEANEKNETKQTDIIQNKKTDVSKTILFAMSLLLIVFLMFDKLFKI